MWILMIVIILFMVVIIRFAIRSGLNGPIFSSMPSGSEAYEIAKVYIKPTLKSPDVQFAEGEYQLDKSADSVYVVKSFFVSRNIVDEKIKTNFTITLKYQGGTISNDKNWTVLNLEEY